MRKLRCKQMIPKLLPFIFIYLSVANKIMFYCILNERAFKHYKTYRRITDCPEIKNKKSRRKNQRNSSSIGLSNPNKFSIYIYIYFFFYSFLCSPYLFKYISLF
ncbi:Schizosaccharomyces pombe specific protein [Schizosaccharomyces pombe]|uniref:Uncharacterized membrane protein PB8E5.08 n=1 Tax=Schizosaccharomyces pombe (strain 972 / ATCC 24843) TaxID=284812 RepID=YLN8_SCHPO|nr:uncharacterized protein SPAPB8E5.08 [Schizosaccharomyces pombe]Q9C0X7.1 RecName: Full=Uncharacterized membrane protein PB8E5.08 [Schizosaccharomyces pombe 972h-]CAC37427.1 dubious [Schizosaccharomyces pombe]|eukprot:NP_594782.1 uncharacterized protein SPAPB8E5.08 [Schizosaccharomyces pombe]